MEVRNFTKEEIYNMHYLSMVTSEGDIALVNDKAIKLFRRTSGDYFSNKLFTIHSLADDQSLKSIKELVLPEKIITIDKKIVGFTMPHVKGVTLEEYLDSDVSIDLKINALKKVGNILEKMKELRIKNQMPDFFINDLHEKNFIVNLDSKEVSVVDLDSCSIDGNLKFGSKYLSYLTPLDGFKKYKKVETFTCGADYIPSMDTDLYCYIIMVLNFLSNIDFHKLSVEEANKYFEYLSNIGLNKELLDNISKIYSEDKNVNIADSLDYIKEVIGKSRVRIR